MDIGNTYATAQGLRVMLYAEPAWDVPEQITLTRDGVEVIFYRLLPESLRCGAVDGVRGECTNPECHRLPLRKCQCGRHNGRTPFTRAVRPPEVA